jgi:hypothetical protein
MTRQRKVVGVADHDGASSRRPKISIGAIGSPQRLHHRRAWEPEPSLDCGVESEGNGPVRTRLASDPFCEPTDSTARLVGDLDVTSNLRAPQRASSTRCSVLATSMLFTYLASGSEQRGSALRPADLIFWAPLPSNRHRCHIMGRSEFHIPRGLGGEACASRVHSLIHPRVRTSR